MIRTSEPPADQRLSPDYFSLAAARAHNPARTDKYARFLHVTDPLADELVVAFSEMPSGRGRKLMDTALDHGLAAVPNPPAALRRLFEQLDDVPLWVDWEQLDQGGRTFLRSGLSGPIVLGLYALPLDYSSPAGAKPLVFSGTLLKRAGRRLAETGRFAVATCQPGGLRRFSDGFKTTVRVRLMHAQVRRLIQRSGRWNDGWGAPINQVFMAGTNLSLSVILLDGLRRLGWRLPEAEREAVMQVWRYSGYLSGLHPELTAANETEARRLTELIITTQAPPDADSRALIDALMNVRLFPGTEQYTWMTDLYYGLSRALMGREKADALHFPTTPWRFMLPALRALILAHEVGRRVLPGGQQWAYDTGAWAWNLALNSALRGQPADYKLPERLEPQLKEHPVEKRYA